MPKGRQKTRWVGPPMPKRRKKAAAAPVEEGVAEETAPPIALDTTEQVISEMHLLCDQVDEQMAKEMNPDRGRMDRDFDRYWQNAQPWREFFDRRAVLVDRLHELRGKKPYDDDDRAAFLRPHLMRVAFGEVPSWARPGIFVRWIGATMPVCCIWDGFIEPGASAVAMDPARLWVERSGHLGLGSHIRADQLTVDDFFRWQMVQWTTAYTWGTGKRNNEKILTFKPMPLDPEGRASATKLLTDYPFLREQLKRGPVNPVPMPKHIRSVQMALMA